ncbi:MAG: amino acid ABC transporter substrate-binding protein [Oscillospiraceae bacterium]
MKRFITVLLVFALAATLLAGCGAAPATTPEEPSGKTDAPALLGADDTFVVGFDQDFPPYGYVGEDGEFTGFDLECAKAVATRLGWKIELQPIEWAAKDLELDNGAIDCIWNGFTMNGREDEYEWTEPYVDNSQVFVVKADSGVSDFAALAGKNVAVQKDSSALAALNDNEELKKTFGELIEVGEYNTAFMDLEQGAIDAVAMDIGVAKFQMKGREGEFKILDEALMAEQYGIGFKLGNKALRDAVQTEFVEMVKDGTVAEISAKFFDGENICIIKP